MRLLCTLIPQFLFVALSTYAASDAPAPYPAPGEWPCFRANSALDGHAAIKGAITQPQLAWRALYGVADTSYALHPKDAGGAAPGSASDARWGLTGPAGLVGGQTAPVENTRAITYADILPDAPGLEKFEFDSGFDKPTVNNQWQPVTGRCLAWVNGAWSKVWESDLIDMLFIPLPIVGDFDKDGAPEVAILPWNELLLLDARTGKVKDRCKFTEGRSYGALMVDDLDGDGLKEFVVLADFAKHIDVLGYKNGKLSLLWRREVELSLDHSKKAMRVHPHAIADVTGDGKKEIAVSLFNDSGDQHWHVLVLDGMTGAVMADFDNELLQGVIDVTGDGAADLLTCSTKDANTPEYGTIRIHRFAAGKFETVWSRDAAGWQVWSPPTPLNVNTDATRGKENVLARATKDGAIAVVRQAGDAGQRKLTLLRCKNGAFAMDVAVSGARLTGLGLDADGDLLFQTSGPPEQTPAPTADAGTLTKFDTKNREMYYYTTPLVARDTPGAAPSIVVQSPGEELVSFRCETGGGAPKEIARFVGRAQGPNWPNTLGSAFVDLNGSGGRSVVYSTASPDGCARLVVADVLGHEVWHHDFPKLPGTPPIWNTGGIIFWQAGHFTDPKSQDVLVQIRKTLMHTEETLLLSGKDGRELWRRDKQVNERGVGGTACAIADYDGDGLDDAASFHPSICYTLKGTSGHDIVAKEARWAGLPLEPAFWGLAIAGEFEQPGKTGIYFASSKGALDALVRTDGTLAWWTTLDEHTAGYPAFGRFDASGRMQSIAPGSKEGLRCFDTATGKMQWQLALPVTGEVVGTASGDLNGDGRDEALFLFGTTLYCVGCDPATNQGKILWRYTSPITLGPPIIADLGDGKASILLAGLDGYLYCLR